MDALPNVVSLTFGAGYASSGLKIMELPNDMLDGVLNGTVRPVIKGKDNEEAVLCTDDKTFSVKLAESSNTCLLVPPQSVEKSSSAMAVDEDESREIKCSFNQYFEIQEMAPKIHQLKALLRQRPYTDEDDGDTAMEGSADAEHLYTRSDLESLVQASSHQIDMALEEMGAVEIKGYWRVLDNAYIVKILDLVLALSEQHDWSLSAIDAAQCAKLLDTFDPAAVKHVVRIHSSSYPAKQLPPPEEDMLSLVTLPVCRTRALQLFQIQSNWKAIDFLMAWSELCPPSMPPDVAHLKGMAIQDVRQGVDVIVELDLHKLPLSPKDRFARLFAIRKKWTKEELEPYIMDLETPSMSVGKLLMKHTRVSQQMGQKDAPAFYSMKQ